MYRVEGSRSSTLAGLFEKTPDALGSDHGYCWVQGFLEHKVPHRFRKVYIRLPGKGDSNSRGARPVYSFR